jgi:hypothetical protein
MGKENSTEDHTHVYFANYTKWGPQAANYLAGPAMQGVSFSLGVEHHLKKPALEVAARQLGKEGWRLYSTPAQQSATEMGSAAGAWVMARKHLTSHGRQCKPSDTWPESTLKGSLPGLPALTA